MNDEKQSDIWSEWLLHRRHGGDPDVERLVRGKLEALADRVLDAARLEPDTILVDVGTGDGLIALRAIERMGSALQVILTDISAPMLRHVQEIARERGVARQCRFHQCSADSLEGIEPASVDVVTTRAVLAYVENKAAAFREFQRILRPDGRISILEPILQDEALAVSNLRSAADRFPDEFRQKVMTLLHRWKATQYPDTLDKMMRNPLTNYSERDLVRFAQDAGFDDIHMEFHVDVARSDALPWQVSLESSPHPLAPPLGVILAEQFTPEERTFFEEAIRPCASVASASVTRAAYLTARKPSA